MKYIGIITLASLFLISCTSDNKNASLEEWETLFNGKDLSGWNIKIAGYDLNDNFGDTFYVEDSLMKVKYDAYDIFNNRFGHIFYEKNYSYYKLSIEYRFVGDQSIGGPGWAYRNSGVMVHGQSAQSMGKDQDFPASIEVQLLGGNGTDKRSTCNLCTPGTNVVYEGKLDTRHCINSTSETYHGDQWVKAEIVVLGDSIIHHIMEGDTVLQYEKPQLGGGSVSGHNPEVLLDGKLLSEGSISLQSESHPVHFKSVQLLNLKGCMDKEAKNYKSYYIKNNPESCVY